MPTPTQLCRLKGHLKEQFLQAPITVITGEASEAFPHRWVAERYPASICLTWQAKVDYCQECFIELPA